MTHALTTIDHTAPAVQLIPLAATGQRLSRLREFERWLEHTGRTWRDPDLVEFQRYLLERDETRHVGTYSTDNHEHEAGDPIVRHYGPIAPTSIRSFASTIRGRYRELLEDNETRDALYQRAGSELAAMGQADTPVNRKAIVDETLTRLENALKPGKGDVVPVKVQDRVDEQVGVRLTRAQADLLLASPGLDSLAGLRDTAILAVLLVTGLREAELVGLEVRDLRQTVDGELCVHVRRGKGRKARAVPWGDGDWALAYVDAWLKAAGIEDGRGFRSFYGVCRLRKSLSTRAVQQIVAQYPVMVGGKLIKLRPHDLRRTFARLSYDAGMDLKAISENLGHASIATTRRYVGLESVESRKPPALYTPPHWAKLAAVEA